MTMTREARKQRLAEHALEHLPYILPAAAKIDFGERIVQEPGLDDNDEAREIAEKVINILDGNLSRQQVYAVAKWVRYLATQC